MAAPPRLLLERLRARTQAGPGTRLAIGAAAQRLGTTPRMLRYREAAGLLPGRRGGRSHRVYGERELLAAACAEELEERYGVSPKALGFALRALSDPDLASEVRLLGALAHGVAPTPIAALDFDAQKARRLLHLQDENA